MSDDGLKKRELEVLNLVKLGYTNKEIGSQLGISEQAVKNDLEMIFTELGAKNRVDAVIKALQAGYIQLSQSNQKGGNDGRRNKRRGVKAMTQDRVTRMQQRIMKVVQEEIQGWMNDLLRGMIDPAKIMAFARSMGIDPSKLAGMVGQQPGFDSYKVLGLEKSATDEEVKKRYREIMDKLHPDKAGQEMTFLAAIVNAAYQMICQERGIT